MTTSDEHTLREALKQLATVPVPRSLAGETLAGTALTRANRMRRRRIVLATAGAAVLAAAAAAPVIRAGADTQPIGAEPYSTGAAFGSSPASAPDAAIVLGAGANHRDRTASQTVGDWVTYADHVLVVTAVAEAGQPPSRDELERGEGMIGRVTTLRVDTVLWSAPDAPQPAPAPTLTWSSAGWIFNNNNGLGTVKFGMKDSSRIEIGHTYVLAIEWIDDPCSRDPAKGEWDGLGSGGTIPFDGGILGVGEFEGRVRTLDEAKARAHVLEPVARFLRDEMVGEPVATLVAALQASPPRGEKGYVSRECDPRDR